MKLEKAIELFRKRIEVEEYSGMTTNTLKEAMKTVLNELEKKDKVIDEMAKYMAEEFAEYQLDYIYQKVHNAKSGMERNWSRGIEEEIKDIKEYFYKKVR